ncbi:D-alanyl-D-alanine carboxypeptidase family protein [Clostridium sp. JN-9]|uniref:D-alanyl-D-alanine carboxypeptidase family protein n=1 Tax=Clostridium sp. JN-9 TaxID=2507159 RepID=UPI000FFE0785|nr:D-alanyl-D-alanine carboxypeptidase family protein [Clostridium sp. JN-9]QAT39604.1 D-alanyl-D-alanine carboxypeptidase [Clostridium sp. JN-9]
MRKFVVVLSICLLIFSSFNGLVYAKDNPPAVSADSAVLMDATTGQVLYGKNMDTAYPPASTTKIMTALLTLENCNLDDVVTVGKNPPLAEGSKIYLFEGEKIKVRDLLYGLILVSANDCAEALAEYISGSLDKFAEKMNARALELGCEDTNFVNPSGLFDPKHKTSAKDLALIMRRLVINSEYEKIATTQSYKIAPTNKSALERPLWNENKLIQKGSKYYYEGCEGGKTGYTTQSDHSYVASATRNGHRLIVALVHDKNKTFFADAPALLNYGFNNFDLVKLYNKGDIISDYKKSGIDIPLLANDDIYYINEKDSTVKPSIDISTESDLALKKVHKGDIVGKIIVGSSKNSQSYPLTSSIDHNLTTSIENVVSNKNNNNFYIAASLLLVAGIVSFAYIKYRREKQYK